MAGAAGLAGVSENAAIVMGGGTGLVPESQAEKKSATPSMTKTAGLAAVPAGTK
ncbi:hypothetical protein AGMMS49942_15140 [Spirochaetia bacterium]|nr:hypothetical protein AGMMS49942_15140 [Spirochaetia bacterium]